MEEGRAEVSAELLGPAGAGEDEGEGELLLLEEVLAEEAGEEVDDGAVGEEEVVGITEAAARLVGAVVGGEGGEGDGVGEGEGEGAGAVEGGGGGEKGGGTAIGGAVAVVEDEADGGGGRFVEGVGEGDAVGFDAGRGRDALEGDDDVEDVVVRVEELGLLLLLCPHPHPLEEGIHRLPHRLPADLPRRRRRNRFRCCGDH